MIDVFIQAVKGLFLAGWYIFLIVLIPITAYQAYRKFYKEVEKLEPNKPETVPNMICYLCNEWFEWKPDCSEEEEHKFCSKECELNFYKTEYQSLKKYRNKVDATNRLKCGATMELSLNAFTECGKKNCEICRPIIKELTKEYDKSWVNINS